MPKTPTSSEPHFGAVCEYVLLAERLDQDGLDLCGEGWVVVEDRGGLIFEHRYFGGFLWGEAGGEGEAGGDLGERVQGELAATVGEGAGGELELDGVRDDVALGAAVDVADGDDGGVSGILLATDDGLDVEDVTGGEDDGVAAEVGVGAVAADALDEDIDGGAGGHGGADGERDGAGGVSAGVVEADDHVGVAEALEEVIGDHGFGSVYGLF